MDNDHIKGITNWFSKDADAEKLIERVWFNSGKLIKEYFKKPELPDNEIGLLTPGLIITGIEEGVTFEKRINAAKIWQREIIRSGMEIDFYNVKFRIISPDESGLKKLLGKWEKEFPDSLTVKETDYQKTLKQHVTEDKQEYDSTPHNGSSIAFILTYKEKHMLYLSDAHVDKIISGMDSFGYNAANSLVCKFAKISHHGSKYNTSRDLLKTFNAEEYVISSDGTAHSPYKQTLARLIDLKKNVKLFFNYPKVGLAMFQEQDFKDYPGLSLLPEDHKFMINE